jgi:hypothetical protein
VRLDLDLRDRCSHKEDVFEALSVDGIVRIVTMRHTEQSGSDENERDNFVEPSLNASQAIDCARDLHEYVMAVPEAFASPVTIH